MFLRFLGEDALVFWQHLRAILGVSLVNVLENVNVPENVASFA